MPLDRASLEKLIEASPDIVVATDADGKVSYYNEGAREYLGYSRDEVIGQHVTLFYADLEEAKRVMRAMRAPDKFGKARVDSFPTRFVAKDGHEIPVAISGVILYGSDGEEQGTIGFAKDLSEIMRRDQLAVLGEIAIGLSHEINNPLEVITNQLALLERFVASRASPAELVLERNRIDSVKSEVDRISSLLNRLREMAEQEEYASAPYVDDARMIDLSEANGDSPLAGAHILVVDDDPGVRETMAELLQLEGAEVALAENGLAAVAKLDAAHFDLVLSDVVMPDMDGYELFQECRRRFPDTPVALMTAFYYDREHVIKRSRLEGLEGVLFKKPIDPERLRETLGGMLKPARRAPS